MKRDMGCFRRALLLTMPLSMALTATSGITAFASDYTGPAVYINEMQVSTTGTDWEFVELQGTPDTSLDGLTLIGIESDAGSSTGTIDTVISLDGQTIPGTGFWVAISPAGTTAYAVTGQLPIPDNSFENSSASYLLVSGFTGAKGDDLDTNADGILDLEPWTEVLDSIAIVDAGVDDVSYATLTLGPDGTYLPSGVFRCPDAPEGDFDSDFLDFSSPDGTPGEYNCTTAPLPTGVCGDVYTPIYTIQGSGLASELTGEVVATEGLVVGDFQDGKSGFYIQDMTGDGNTATSDGIFVYATSLDVSVGDRVRVTGTVKEYYDLTELSDIDEITICSTGNEITPTDISLPVASLEDFESFEGMLVRFPQELNIAEFYNFDRYGEIVLTTERQYQPTAVYEPGSPEAETLTEGNSLSRITLDDGRSSQNPDPAIHPNGYIFDLDNLFRGGDMLANVTGVMDYNYGLYVIQPTTGAEYIPANPRPELPEVGGSLKVASFNVLNYFTTIDHGEDICGPAADMECRGADTDEEFERQHAKIVAALAAMDADIVGLIEIENNIDDTPTINLVNGLNDMVGAGTYNYVATGAIGGDAIRVAFIYKTATARPVGAFAILNTAVDSRFIDDKNRPALAQSFQDLTAGGIFTVAVNHLKSKGSACDDIGDPDTGDGSGNCNLTRTLAAEALVDWLATDPTGAGSDKFLIIGDLNSYDKEEPIATIKAGADDLADSDDDYIDLLDYFEGEYSYSYVFDGQLGYLDHALANKQFFTDVTGTAVCHINADEVDLIDYDMSYKKDAQDALYADDPYRSSDHDAVLVGVKVCEEVAPTLEVTLSQDKIWPPNHKYVEIEASVSVADNFDANPTLKLVSVTSSEPDNDRGDGTSVKDIVIIDDLHFLVRAERSGFGSGRVYTATYSVTDACGNTATAEATVTVEKRSKKYTRHKEVKVAKRSNR